MVKKKIRGGIITILLILIIGLMAVWYYITISNQHTPSRGVYVSNIQEKYGGSSYGSLYQAL